MITIVKFIENPNPDSSNSVISRTLGKVGVFNARDGSVPPGMAPAPREFWRVEIAKEVITHKPGGSSGGCFVLRPISKIGVLDDGKPDLTYLIAGGYDTSLFKTSLVILPRTLGFNWMADLDLRHHLRDQYRKDGTYGLTSFVVSLDGTSEWPVEESGENGDTVQPEKSNSTIYSRRSGSMVTKPPGGGSE